MCVGKDGYLRWFLNVTTGFEKSAGLAFVRFFCANTSVCLFLFSTWLQQAFDLRHLPLVSDDAGVNRNWNNSSNFRYDDFEYGDTDNEMPLLLVDEPLEGPRRFT